MDLQKVLKLLKIEREGRRRKDWPEKEQRKPKETDSVLNAARKHLTMTVKCLLLICTITEAV